MSDNINDHIGRMTGEQGDGVPAWMIEHEERRCAMAKANNAVYDGAVAALAIPGVSRLDVAEILERCALEIRRAAREHVTVEEVPNGSYVMRGGKPVTTDGNSIRWANHTPGEEESDMERDRR